MVLHALLTAALHVFKVTMGEHVQEEGYHFAVQAVPKTISKGNFVPLLAQAALPFDCYGPYG